MNGRFLVPWAIVFGLAASTAAQQPAAEAPAAANPELIGLLTKELGVTPAQAAGGAGALLGLAKTRLKPEEFAEVSAAVPGTDALIKAAPAPKGTAAALGGLAGSSAGLAGLAGTFTSLGVSADAATKFAPTLLKYVNGKGASSAASLLTRAFK